MGSLNLPLEELRESHKFEEMKEIQLKNSKGQPDKSMGTISLVLHWIYTKEMLSKKKKPKSSFLPNPFSAKEEKVEDSDDEGDDGVDPLAAKQMTDAEIQALKDEEEEEKKKLQASLDGVSIENGDYQVQVHVIEARELKAKDLEGTSDPVVYVKCLGETQTTEVKEKCLNCVFDELFIINKRDMDKEDFDESLLKLEVMDADSLTRNDLIGSYTVDLSWIYFRPRHELYRSWVGLSNDEDPEENPGIQGYLKISVQIVGPNDKLYIHDEKKDKEEEKKEEAKKNGGMTGLILMPPTIKRSILWLKTTILRADYLPKTDASILTAGGIDAFFTVNFGSIPPCSTAIKKVKGNRDDLNPTFNYELWVPVNLPTSVRNVQLKLYDNDFGGANETIATTFFCWGKIMQAHANSFKQAKIDTGEEETKGSHDEYKNEGLSKIRTEGEPFWVPLYGGPMLSATQNISATTRRGGGTDYLQYYNTHPDAATTYRGSVLLSQEIVPHDRAPEREQVNIKVPWRRKINILKKKIRPPKIEKLALSAIVYTGNELLGDTSSKLSIQIVCGKYMLETKKELPQKGCADWFDFKYADDLGFPYDAKQVPDVFVYLCQNSSLGGVEPVAYYRISAADLLEKGFSSEGVPDPTWLIMKEDKALDKLNSGTFPGTLLISLALGKKAEFDKVKHIWQDQVDSSKRSQLYELRVHLYQARNLPDADLFDGGIDPFFKVRFAGHTPPNDTEPVMKNNDPLIYETLTIKNVSLPLDSHLIPQVNVQVWDKDKLGSDYVGLLLHKFSPDEIIEVRELIRNGDQSFDVPVPKHKPAWHKIMREEIGDCEGEVLLSFQLLKMEQPDSIINVSPSIQPEFRKAAVEIICIGIRDMAPYACFPIQIPSMKFTIDGVATLDQMDKEGNVSVAVRPTVYQRDTATSKKPSPANANFLERIVVDLELPIDTIFTPPLKISVIDTRLGGFSTPEVGRCVVPLYDKCPWDKKTYVKRNMDMFCMDANKDAANERASVLEQKHQIAKDRVAMAAGTKFLTSGGGKEVEDDKSPGVKDVREEEKNETEGKEEVPLKLQKDENDMTPSELLAYRKGKSDKGCGVFPAMHHVSDEDNMLIKMEKERKRKMAERKKRVAERERKRQLGLIVLEEDDNDDDLEEEIPSYMKERQTLDEELECQFPDTPFDTYKLHLGSKIGALFMAPDYRIVGIFKGIVRVLEDAEAKADFDVNGVLKPTPTKVRIYVLRGIALEKKDTDILGNPVSSDPYLKISLGKNVWNGVDEHLENETEADFYKYVEFNADIPGATRVNLEVFDYDDFGSDDLIGRTVIDLEDRWFDKRWVAMGQGKEVDNTSWQLKPLEKRTLHIPTYKQGQGVLECFVDILRPEEATAYPPFDISLPPTLQCEVRIVIWKAKEVVAMDWLEQMNDLYVKCWLEGSPPQTTDVHWRAKKGKGSWNFRMKFDVELGHRTKLMKFPYLHLQMWDQDVLKWNDIIAETTLNLEIPLKKAYKRQIGVEVFKDPPKKSDTEDIPEIDDMNLEFDEDDDEAPLLGDKTATAASDPPPPVASQPEANATEIGVEMSSQDPGHKGDDSAPENKEDDSETGSLKAPLVESSSTPPLRKKLWTNVMKMRKSRDKNKSEPTMTWKECFVKYLCVVCMSCKGFCAWCPIAPMCPMLPCCIRPADEDSKKEGDDEIDESAQAVIDQFKEIVGMAESKPANSEWLTMEKYEHAEGIYLKRGKLCLSINILPKAIADSVPAGFGRTAPNTNPFLPPPAGRLKFTLNPFAMGSQLCGPALCAQFTCCLVCVASVLLMIFCQPVFNFVISLWFYSR